jgi:hypothetical protein
MDFSPGAEGFVGLLPTKFDSPIALENDLADWLRFLFGSHDCGLA